MLSPNLTIKKVVFFVVTYSLFFSLTFLANKAMASRYMVGSGMYDITGPAGELGMMGFAELSQKTQGLRMRLFARAFIVVDKKTNKRIVFVSADLGQSFQSIKQGVIKRLASLGFAKKYRDENVMISVTHNHSGPGGYAHFALFNMSTLGFNQENYDTIVDGISNAIIRADNNLSEGGVYYNEGKLYRASKNRSIDAFYANPVELRRELAGDETNKTMYLLRFRQSGGKEIGLVNWFATHGVSMSKYNKLITGDNKGYASYLFEKSKNSNYRAKSQFVAAFAQGSAGDVSPNIFGLKNGGRDFYRTQEIGQRQYEKARELYQLAQAAVNGDIDYRLQYINMSDYAIKPEFADGHAKNTCPSAVGVSFTQGTNDGKGVSIDKDVLKAAGIILTQTSDKDRACHAPKDIFLTTANTKPYPWLPNIVPIQILKLGNIAIIGVPGELSTVAGQMLKNQVKAALKSKIDTIIISSLANSYTGYITTHDEYLKQAYEGGFTVYGPWTLNAYLQAFNQLASALSQKKPSPLGPKPLDLSQNQITLQTGVVYDNTPLGIAFGDVISKHDALTQYKPGQKVAVLFWGGHPKNNFHHKDKSSQESFLYIQRLKTKHWVNIADDHDWNTTYRWKRYGLDASHISIEWEIPDDITAGTYRIVHKGYYKNGFTGAIKPYQGYSRTFIITPNPI
jgi:neutral ceramidase